jgi:hypothetical protein
MQQYYKRRRRRRESGGVYYSPPGVLYHIVVGIRNVSFTNAHRHAYKTSSQTEAVNKPLSLSLSLSHTHTHTHTHTHISVTQIGNFSSIAVVSTLQYSHHLCLFFCSNAGSSNRPWIVAAVEGSMEGRKEGWKDARKKHDNSKSKTQCREKRREGEERAWWGAATREHGNRVLAGTCMVLFFISPFSTGILCSLPLCLSR